MQYEIAFETPVSSSFDQFAKGKRRDGVRSDGRLNCSMEYVCVSPKQLCPTLAPTNHSRQQQASASETLEHVKGATKIMHSPSFTFFIRGCLAARTEAHQRDIGPGDVVLYTYFEMRSQTPNYYGPTSCTHIEMDTFNGATFPFSLDLIVLPMPLS